MKTAQDCEGIGLLASRAAAAPLVAASAKNRDREPVPPALVPRPSIACDRPWLALAMSLAAVGVATKLVLLPFPVSSVGDFARWLLRLGLVASSDVCFAAGLAVACWLVSLALGPWPAAAGRAWRIVSAGLFGLCAVYAVASIPMFKVTKVPFTVRLLSFVGGADVMVSSAGQYFPPGIVALLIAAPLAVMLAPWAGRRRPLCFVMSPMGLKTSGALLALVAVGGGWSQHYLHARAEWADPNRWERRIAQSPHWVLIASCAEELAKDRPFTQSFSFEEIDDSDFRGAPPASVDSALLADDQRPKNVLLIVLESTGVEYVGAHGSRFPTTPHLDKLAETEGIVFENIYSQAASSCKSLVALSNSVYDRPDWLLIVRDHPQFDVPALPRVLRDSGYRTCYAHSGYWGWQKRDQYLQARGVDQLLDAASHPGEEINSWGIRDQTMYQDLLAWIDADRSRPFFALAYTIETHHPYHAGDEHYDFGVEDPELARYLDCLRGADAKIAWLMRELERRGLKESTLVIVTADHGESFGQHNQRTHSFGIYEQTVHVPLVLLHPSLKNLPRREASIGRHIDVAPTVLDLLGIAAPAAWQGRSLMRRNDDARAYFLSVGNEVVLGLRDGRYKYHYYVDTSREELFDVESDPRESRDLVAAEPERARRYRSRLGGWVTYQREFLAQHGVR